MKAEKMKRVLALTMVICMCMTNTTYAQNEKKNVKSTVSMNKMDFNDIEKMGSTQSISENDSSIETVSLNNVNYENGEYLVYVDNEKKEEVVEEIIEEVSQVEVENYEEGTLYVADLTASQAQELAVEKDVYVEENIEFAASGNKKSQQSMKKPKKNKKDRSQDYNGKRNKNKRINIEKVGKENAEEMNVEGLYEWNLEMIHVGSAEEIEQNNIDEKIKVAILDSGVELITDIPVVESVNLVEDEQDITFYMNDMTGHGTAVADIVTEINPNAEIYGVRVLDSDNRATLSRIIEGIHWCMEKDVDIINMSFGTNVESEILKKTIQEAYEQGILLVSSAGNCDSEGVEYPAAYDEVMAVGAVNTSAMKTEESAVGEEVEIVAPGEQIRATSILGFDTVASGTSMAAPHIVGVASILWQKDKTKSNDFIRALIDETANQLGNEEQYGNGLVDLEYALSCYDEFSRNYVPNQKSDSIKQEIEPNEKAVDTFEFVDYVEGRWGRTGHESAVTFAINEQSKSKKILYSVSLGGSDSEGTTKAKKITTPQEINLLKAGAIYPDNKQSGLVEEKEWHGSNQYNYMANYIYATRIALRGGKISNSNPKMVKGQKSEIYKRMNKGIKRDVTDGDKWSGTFTKIFGEGTYECTKRNRQIFLYGMAMHTITDVYAHSVWVKDKSGVYHKLVHNNDKNKNKAPYNCADNSSKYTARFECAKEAAYCVYANFCNQTDGDVMDFEPLKDCIGKFYLGNCVKHATETGSDFYTTEKLKKIFNKINIDVN